jgi:hypothetical protein
VKRVVLKTGNNQKNWTTRRGARYAYKKSFLIHDYAIHNIGSEKAYIKNSTSSLGLYSPKPPITDRVHRSYTPTSSHSHKFIRALLGLTDSYKFLDVSWDDTVSVRHEGGEIERFASPITMKFFGKYLVLLPNAIPVEIFDAPFGFMAHLPRSEQKMKYAALKRGTKARAKILKTPKCEDHSGKAYAKGQDWLIALLERFAAHMNTSGCKKNISFLSSLSNLYDSKNVLIHKKS